MGGHTLLLSPTSSTSLAPLPALSVALAFQPPSRLSSRLSLPSALVRPLSQPQSLSLLRGSLSSTGQSVWPTLLRSSPPSCASPSRWSRPAFPSHSPSSRSLLSSPASPTHPCCLAPLLVSPSSRRSVSSQLSSARLSLSQSPASLRCPPSPSKQYNCNHNRSTSQILNCFQFDLNWLC